MLDTLGAVIGPLVAFGLLYFVFVNIPLEEAFRNIFLIAIIPRILSILLIIVFVKEKKDGIKKEINLNFDLSLFDKETKKFLFIIALVTLANFSYAFLLLRAENMGVAILILPLMYFLYNVIYAQLAIPIGNLADKLDNRIILGTSYFIYALMCIGFIYLAGIWAVVGLFILYGIFSAINDTVTRTYVSKINEDHEGLFLGTYHSTIGLALLPASILAGYFWTSFGFEITFWFAAGISVLAGILMIFWLKNGK